MKRGLLMVVLGLLVTHVRAQNPADFGVNAAPLPSSRPVLLALPNYPGLTVLGTSFQWYQLLFDSVTSDSPPRFSVAGWASETSNRRFTLTPAAFAIGVSMTADDSFDAIQAANPALPERDVNYYWIARIVKALIDSGFDFRAFDANHNGNVECPSELTICIINPAIGNVGGVNRGFQQQQDAAGTFVVSGVGIIVGHLAHFDTVLHEFAHSFGVPYELYTHIPGIDSVNTGMSIMGGTGHYDPGATNVFSENWHPARMHFDPYHKFRFGWSQPRFLSLRDGGRLVLPVATSGILDAPVILHDPLRGTHEFFILEYRSRFQPGPNYDAHFAIKQPFDAEGLVIWQVATRPDHSLFDKWSPTDPALNPPASYSSSILPRCPPNLNVTSNQPWASGQETPLLKWFDGASTSARIRVLPFAKGSASITVDVLVSSETWVDFAYTGPENGSFEAPYNTVAEGAANAGYGGRLRIKVGRTSETVASLNRRMTFEAVGPPGSTAVIGRLP